VEITKYRNGRESYDFKISKQDMEGFISGLVSSVVKGGVKPTYYWVNSKGNELIKLIVEDENG
jgi:hypothetical protein